MTHNLSPQQDRKVAQLRKIICDYPRSVTDGRVVTEKEMIAISGPGIDSLVSHIQMMLGALDNGRPPSLRLDVRYEGGTHSILASADSITISTGTSRRVEIKMIGWIEDIGIVHVIGLYDHYYRVGVFRVIEKALAQT